MSGICPSVPILLGGRHSRSEVEIISLGIVAVDLIMHFDHHVKSALMTSSAPSVLGPHPITYYLCRAFVEELGEVPEGSVVIFSAHGVAKSVWEEANRRRLHVIDATCPLVIKVHNEVNRDYTQGYDLILMATPAIPK